MSIIYDALKKVEESGVRQASLKRIKPDNEPPHRINPLLVYALIVSFAVFGANTIFGVHASFSSRRAVPQAVAALASHMPRQAPQIAPPAPTPPPAAKKQDNQAEFVLNGIFYSGKDAYALINNQIVKAKGVVDGAVVRRVDLEGVELQRDGELIEIPANR